jgi:hypothetical protein
MPIVPFTRLPADARLWVFASEKTLDEAGESKLLAVVDDFLQGWAAHGEPLTSGRELKERRFLGVGVDQTAAQASGCSIDGLYRALRQIEPLLGASLLQSGRVYYRAADGGIEGVTRDAFSGLAEHGSVTADTEVFDTAVVTVGEWRQQFERPAGSTWHRTML